MKFFQEGVDGCREPPNKPGFPEFSGAQTPTGAPARKRPRRRLGPAMPGHGRNDTLGHGAGSRSECVAAGELYLLASALLLETEICRQDREHAVKPEG